VSRPAGDRFWEKVDQRGPDECWPWLGWRTPKGYGMFRPHLHSTTSTATRFAYEQRVGPIPVGMHLDHLCRNPPCCNPSHLEPVTPRENMMRGNSILAINARKTECMRGHPFDEVNTYRTRLGRGCWTCKRLRGAA
jgi:hypothetical protein